MSTSSEVTVQVNGTTLSQINATDYSEVVNFTKDAVITFSGLDDIASYYFDPDYLYLSGMDMMFKAATGLYTVDMLGYKKNIRFKRMKDATTKATINEHGLWLMGWGVASPSVKNYQFGWNPGYSYCVAETANDSHVYRFSGKASNGEYDQTVGTRFRSDYLSFKYFGQDGWGAEKGKMLSPDATVELTANAAALLKDAGDLMLKDGVQLVPGATYVLTIDLSVLGKETIDFYKQD
jgi:hypothetical protein